MDMNNSVQNNEYCTGCSNCACICPTSAIQMTINSKGFLNPIVDADKCVNCGSCLKSCHFLNGELVFSDPLSILAVKNKIDKERKMSSSGGLFIALAGDVIEKGGVVYGAAFDKDIVVRHIRAEALDDAYRCCQSKYVQSNSVDAIPSVLKDLRNNRKVLFVGTPCQISALKILLSQQKISEENILFVDFICHGTPSPLVFKDYLLMLEKKYKSRITEFYFRDKDQGWRGNGYKAVFKTRKPVINGFYLRGFNKLFSLSTNEACFHCKYSRPQRISDITLGDFWGIEKTPISAFEDKLGVSMVLINTEKGCSAIKRVDKKLETKDAELDYCKYNTPLFSHPARNKEYYEFWDSYGSLDYEKTFDTFCKFTGKKGVIERGKWIILYKLNLKDYILKAYARHR